MSNLEAPVAIDAQFGFNPYYEWLGRARTPPPAERVSTLGSSAARERSGLDSDGGGGEAGGVAEAPRERQRPRRFGNKSILSWKRPPPRC